MAEIWSVARIQDQDEFVATVAGQKIILTA
jgi:hypothetical protein